MSAPKMIMPMKRFRTSTCKALTDRRTLLAMMMTASKRLPSLKARMTLVRRIILSTTLSSPPQVSNSWVRYQGRMAKRSMRFDQFIAQDIMRPSIEGTLIASSVTIQLSSRSFSASTSSDLINAESSSRTAYSDVKRITHTRSMTPNVSSGSGLQVALYPGMPGSGHFVCIAGRVETMKLPVETKMATNISTDQSLPRMLLSASSNVRKIRSATVSRTKTPRCFHSMTNSAQLTLPLQLPSYSELSNLRSSLRTLKRRTMARWNTTNGTSWSSSTSADIQSCCRPVCSWSKSRLSLIATSLLKTR
mmetsp:Transcript_5461/g.12410  ORF Transcript_5461/g.12410 Transcript_5461/m.12410 type:complete len:305 (-) Transcript_5461:154-1068(-)